jgi:enoyl-CoA hydratase/carnithine racemase
MATLAPKSFKWEVRRGVGTITLSRPDILNALTFEIYRELTEHFERLHEHPEIRAVVLAGEGRAFCSGGDVNDIIGPLLSYDMKGLLDFTRLTGRLVTAIRRCPQPVVAAVDGVAAGAGAVIAIACDLRVAGEKARFGFIFPKVGLCGADMGAGWLLPRIIGLGRATELLLTGEVIDVERAAEMGLVNRVVSRGEEVSTAFDLALRLAEGPAFAHAMTKKMLDDEYRLGLSEAIEAEAQAQAICMQHPDFKTAFQAFQEKRPPRFEGAEVTEAD